MIEAIESGVPAQKSRRSIQFMFRLIDPATANPVAVVDRGNPSVVVLIELEDVRLTFSSAEHERGLGKFAETLAQQIALMAVEKDFPDGVAPSLSAMRIDQFPPELENRLPDFCMNGNNAWLLESGPTCVSQGV